MVFDGGTSVTAVTSVTSDTSVTISTDATVRVHCISILAYQFDLYTESNFHYLLVHCVCVQAKLVTKGEEVTKKEPETITHHCTMCGSRMQIPRPKRERYKVICAHPECGHEDQIGF